MMLEAIAVFPRGLLIVLSPISKRVIRVMVAAILQASSEVSQSNTAWPLTIDDEGPTRWIYTLEVCFHSGGEALRAMFAVTYIRHGSTADH